jgi:hypothetical protein
MKRNYWIPRSNAKFMLLVKRVILYVITNEVRIGFDEKTPFGKWFRAEINAMFPELQSAFNDWEDISKRTSVVIARFNRLRKKFEANIRELVHILKSYPAELIPDDDLVEMGIPPRFDGTREQAPVETEAPGVTLSIAFPSTVTAKFFNVLTGKRGKPAGQHGVEARWVIFDTPREFVHYDDMPHSLFDTRSPFVLALDDHNRGKYLYIAFRWENTRGEKGPFSQIYGIMIP